MYCEGGSPQLTSISFYQNHANQRGGGLYVGGGGTPYVLDCVFTDNDAGAGGGMACWDSNPTLRNVSATSCTGSSGGGVFYENSGGTIVALLLIGNSVGFGGGGMFCYNSSPTIINARFIDNDADYGGGLVTGDASHVQLINPTFYDNTAVTDGGAILCQVSSNPQVVNGILWGNTAGVGEDEIHVRILGGTPSVSYSDVQGGIPPFVTDAGNNINADPLFLPDLRPGPFSPCIDAGNTAANPELGDALFQPRVVGAAIDMGALEYACPTGPVMYVDKDSYSFELGNNWAGAYRDLQVALSTADFCGPVNEIWVAEGTYRTSPLPPDRTASFGLMNGIAIYGGFNGTETLRNQRDWNAHETILTGEIGVAPNPSDNAYHVVHADNVDQTAVLDGFTIRDGNADGGGLDDIGGGILVEGGSPTLANLVIEDNNASFVGGGMANLLGAFPELRDAVIRNNTASSGAGVENDGSSPMFVNVRIEGNIATGAGGGMENFGGNQPQLFNVVFFDNIANFGGGMSNNQSWPFLINVTLGGNTANVRGGAMYNVDFSGPTVTNSVLSGNTANIAGDEVYNETSGGAPTPQLPVLAHRGQRRQLVLGRDLRHRQRQQHRRRPPLLRPARRQPAPAEPLARCQYRRQRLQPGDHRHRGQRPHHRCGHRHGRVRIPRTGGRGNAAGRHRDRYRLGPPQPVQSHGDHHLRGAGSPSRNHRCVRRARIAGENPGGRAHRGRRTQRAVAGP